MSDPTGAHTPEERKRIDKFVSEWCWNSEADIFSGGYHERRAALHRFAYDLVAAEQTKAVASHEALVAALRQAEAENARLDRLLNTPEIHDFAKAVVLEAAHQRERWPDGHDANKTDADWFWLIGYLAGKALHNPPKPTCSGVDARLHRIITVAAAAANWHAAALASSEVRERRGEERP